MNVASSTLSSLVKLSLLVVFVGASLVVATNPDYLLPVAPEFMAIGSLFLFAAVDGVYDPKNLACLDKRLAAAVLSFLILLGAAALWSVRHSPCFAAGSSLFQFECMMQASILIPHGLRQYFLTLIATLVFFLTALMTANRQPNRFISPAYLPVVGLCGLLIGEFYHAIYGRRILPDWAGVSEFSGWWGVSGFFTNYSWVWPYLAPALALGLSLVWSRQARRRYVGVLMTLVIFVLAALNQQRGFLLLIVVCLLTVVLFLLVRFFSVKKCRFSKKSTAALVFFLVILGLAWMNRYALSPFWEAVGLPGLKRDPFSMSNERLILWKFGLGEALSSPFGHGYGSWFAVNRAGYDRKAIQLLFDTPHNLGVELLVEFGFIPTMLIIALTACFIFRCYSRATTIEQKLLVLLATMAAGVCAGVQEITFIRPTYLMWAAFAGGVWGRALASTEALKGDASSTHRRWISARYLFAYGIFSCVLAIFCFRWFGFNGFAYEPNGAGGVSRWFGPVATFTAAPGRKPGWLLYPSTLTAVGEQQTLSFEGLIIDRPAPTGWTFPAKKGTLWGSRMPIKLKYGHQDFSRFLALRTEYPPSTFAVPVTWRKNIEFVGSNKMKCVASPCIFLLVRCGDSNSMGVKIQQGTKIRAHYLDADHAFDMKNGGFDLDSLSEFRTDMSADDATRVTRSRAAMIEVAYDVVNKHEFDLEFEVCDLD
jgi:O-antigen ligase